MQSTADLELTGYELKQLGARNVLVKSSALPSSTKEDTSSAIYGPSIQRPTPCIYHNSVELKAPRGLCINSSCRLLFLNTKEEVNEHRLPHIDRSRLNTIVLPIVRTAKMFLYPTSSNPTNIYTRKPLPTPLPYHSSQVGVLTGQLNASLNPA